MVMKQQKQSGNQKLELTCTFLLLHWQLTLCRQMKPNAWRLAWMLI
jgi:hypothetical protein